MNRNDQTNIALVGITPRHHGTYFYLVYITRGVATYFWVAGRIVGSVADLPKKSVKTQDLGHFILESGGRPLLIFSLRHVSPRPLPHQDDQANYTCEAKMYLLSKTRPTRMRFSCLALRSVAMRPRICMDASWRIPTERMKNASVCVGGNRFLQVGDRMEFRRSTEKLSKWCLFFPSMPYR